MSHQRFRKLRSTNAGNDRIADSEQPDLAAITDRTLCWPAGRGEPGRVLAYVKRLGDEKWKNNPEQQAFDDRQATELQGLNVGSVIEISVTSPYLATASRISFASPINTNTRLSVCGYTSAMVLLIDTGVASARAAP